MAQRLSIDCQGPNVRLSMIYKQPTVKESVKSNQWILFTTMMLFLIFVIAEIIGALASNSLSLLGDAGAMSVDVVTYAMNMGAEWLKARNGGVLDLNTRWILEVYIPSASIIALFAITGWVTSDAIAVIQDNGSDDDVDVVFLYAYAGANALVDVISNIMFYMRKEDVFKNAEPAAINMDTNSIRDGENMHDVESAYNSNTAERSRNLNMMSAFTHVGSDTLRTGAVFFAAVLVSAGNYSSSLCDAWAAVAVTVTIVVFTCPLIYNIFRKTFELNEEGDLNEKLLI